MSVAAAREELETAMQEAAMRKFERGGAPEPMPEPPSVIAAREACERRAAQARAAKWAATASARGGTLAEGLASLRRSDPKFQRRVQAHRALFVAELHGHLPEPRRDEVACQLGVAPHVAVEQPAVVVSPVRPPQRRQPRARALVSIAW